MKVQELIERLKECNQDSIVLLSKDSEGNSYNKLRVIETNMVFDNRWGEVWYSELTQDLIDRGYTEDDVYSGPESDVESVTVFWP